MLDEHYRQEFLSLQEQLDCQVVLPEVWNSNYFSETGVAPTAAVERRSFVRYSYRTKAVLKVEQSLPAIRREPEVAAVYSRDVSRTGIGFLHASQLFPGETCKLMLPTKPVTVVVATCRKLNSQCYLIGARFQSRDEAEKAERPSATDAVGTT